MVFDLGYDGKKILNVLICTTLKLKSLEFVTVHGKFDEYLHNYVKNNDPNKEVDMPKKQEESYEPD